MNNREINSLISSFIKKNGASANDKNRAKVEKMLGGLDSKQSEQLKKILGDPKKSQEILDSPAAKELMKKLMK